MKWVGYTANMDKMKNVYKKLFGKSETPVYRWGHNIKMDLKQGAN
jgi:hypothetical protein